MLKMPWCQRCCNVEDAAVLRMHAMVAEEANRWAPQVLVLLGSRHKEQTYLFLFSLLVCVHVLQASGQEPHQVSKLLSSYALALRLQWRLHLHLEGEEEAQSSS